MDIVAESELAAMIMMSGGSKVMNNMVELIDKMPVLYTYTAGEYSFEFKVDSEPLFYEHFAGYTNNVKTITIHRYPYICFVCKKGTKIISAATHKTIQSGPQIYRRFDSSGNLEYSIDYSDVEITNASVHLNTSDGYADYFMLNVKLTVKYLDGRTTEYPPFNYQCYIMGGSDGNIHHYSTLPESEYAVEYANAVEAVKNSVSENN